MEATWLDSLEPVEVHWCALKGVRSIANLVKFPLIGAVIKTPMKSHISRRQVLSKMGVTFLDLLGPVDAN